MNDSPKVAVLVCGNVRTWDKCQNKEWMNNYDVFGSTYYEKYNYHPYIRGVLQYFDEELVDIPSFLQQNPQFLSLVAVSADRDLTTEATFDKNMKEIYHGYYQYLCMKRGLESIQKYEKEHNIKYDYIIRTRFDINYTPNIKFNFDEGILINSQGCYPDDVIFICKRDIVIQLADYAVKQYTCPENETSWFKPPHGILLNFMNSLKSFKVQMYNFGSVLRK